MGVLEPLVSCPNEETSRHIRRDVDGNVSTSAPRMPPSAHRPKRKGKLHLYESVDDR